MVWGCLAGLPLACWLGESWSDRVLLAWCWSSPCWWNC
nr:hypothetical protein [uncultured Desulfovibrio sp.]